MDYGLVSVIIPTYNRFTMCCRAIESVLAQTYTNIEIIVVNDASTSKEYYENKLESYPKIKVLHLKTNMRELHKCNAAQGKTRDIGIENASGDWIAFLDDDDIWLPRKLEIQLTELKKYPHVFMSSTNWVKLEKETDSISNKAPKYNKKENFLTTDLAFCTTSCVIIHKDIIEKVGKHIIGNAEDYNYWTRIFKYTPSLVIIEPLMLYDNIRLLGRFYKYT